MVKKKLKLTSKLIQLYSTPQRAHSTPKFDDLTEIENANKQKSAKQYFVVQTTMIYNFRYVILFCNYILLNLVYF